MRVLVGCECSARVRDAFRALGHDAWSCDLKECEGESTWHYRMDVLGAITLRDWDIIILHPDCTCLAVSGNRWYGTGTPGHGKRLDAVYWTHKLWRIAKAKAKIGVALENPVGVLSGYNAFGKPQYIQPWQFGHGETKKTGLWLHNLPPLKPTRIVKGREQKVWRMGPSTTRKTDRSRTYAGIAKAMAKQWGSLG